MIHCVALLALLLALAEESPPTDPLEIIHSGNYSSSSVVKADTRILNWNSERGTHLEVHRAFHASDHFAISADMRF